MHHSGQDKINQGQGMGTGNKDEQCAELMNEFVRL